MAIPDADPCQYISFIRVDGVDLVMPMREVYALAPQIDTSADYGAQSLCRVPNNLLRPIFAQTKPRDLFYFSGISYVCARQDLNIVHDIVPDRSLERVVRDASRNFVYIDPTSVRHLHQ